jgi:predicted nucleotidyltransferase
MFVEDNRLRTSKNRVAREAATLLYTSQEKEYKQAKIRAAETLGTRILPSNLEVARELDRIAEEMEGASRRELLLRMRKEALQIMRCLETFHPRLVGSVWRGTAHHNSDVDILAFSLDPNAVLEKLRDSDFRIVRSEWSSVTKEGRRESSFHIHLVLPSGDKGEVVVRGPDKMNVVERCEIYGDRVAGLKIPQLRKILKEAPLQRFVPT